MRDFSFGVFWAGNCIGVASVSLGVLATGLFLEVCGVESLWHDQPGMELQQWEQCLLWDWCPNGVKLWEPGRLLPGKARYWRSDLDLWCRLHPLSQGVALYSGDSSRNLLTSSSREALWHLKLDRPSSRCWTVSAMAWTSSRCCSWTCLTASSMARSCSLMRASSQIFSLSLVIMRVWVCRDISVSILSSVTSQRPSVSVMSLSSNSEPAGCLKVTGSAETVIAVMTPATHSSSMVYIFCRVVDSQQKGMGYPSMWASCRWVYAMHSNFFKTSS